MSDMHEYEESYMLQCETNKCFGCGACIQGCPQKCIRWSSGEFGFLYPHVDNMLCVNCGLCERMCPIGKPVSKCVKPEAYAVVNRNEAILNNSTSGGAFSAIAEKLIESDASVYGSIMDESFQVRHIRASSLSDLRKIRGSKYVQSSIDDVFTQVKDDLKKGKEVLFSGTPCQIAAIHGFLGKEYANLLCIDIVCHGVASQAYFDKFKDYLIKSDSELVSIEFRNKKYVGWSCGGVLHYKGKDKPFYNFNQYYYSYFLSGEIYRNSCYSCPFANMNRIGDITLGDFWGVESINTGFETTQGCSLMLINSEKGRRIMERIQDRIMFVQVNVDEAKRLNRQLTKPTKYKNAREVRLAEYDQLDGAEIQKIYKKTHKVIILRGKLKSMLPYRIKLKLRKML